MKKLWQGFVIAVCFFCAMYAGMRQAHAGTIAYALDISNNQLVTFNTDDPIVWAVIGPTAAAKEFYAGDFRNGDNSTLYAISRSENNLYTIDTATAVETLVGACTPYGGENWQGMTASVGGTLYASSTNISRSTLYTIDPSTGTATVIGEITNAPAIIDIAISTSGQMYGVDIYTNTLVSIDPSTGAGTIIGALGFDVNYSQGMSFDWKTGVLYLAAYGSGNDGGLRIANTATGGTTLAGAFPGGEQVDCLAFHACLDTDSDGYGIGCSMGGDCDDNNSTVHPGAADTTCDGIDQNCNGSFDEGSAGPFAIYYYDRDGDGYGAITSSATVCTGHVPEHYVTDNSDCNDYNASTRDNTYYHDEDGDGYGDADTVMLACEAPAGFVTDNSDVDDTDPFYTDFLPTCEIKIIPRILGGLIGDREGTISLLIIGEKGAEFGDTPAVKWESDAIDVLRTRVFFRRFMFMRAAFNGEPLYKQEYRVLVDDCEGSISWVQ